MNELNVRLVAAWTWFKVRTLSDKIGIIGVIVAILAVVIGLAWDSMKEGRANREKAHERVEREEQNIQDKAQRQADRKNVTDKRRRRICEEFDTRYALFNGRMAVNDRTGAIVAFDAPAGRFTTTDPEFTNRNSKSLLSELRTLANVKTDSLPSEWPPDNELSSEAIQEQAKAFMDQVQRCCK
jgi:hypothetical protein